MDHRKYFSFKKWKNQRLKITSPNQDPCGIGIIGGSGLDDPDILKDATTEEGDTPFGSPSAPLSMGRIGDAEVALLPRHGNRHQYSPTQVNNRANIHALKEAGANHILATTACGSLRREIDRGHFVIVDQFLDCASRDFPVLERNRIGRCSDDDLSSI